MITSEKALSLDSFSEAASIYNSINQNINRFSYVSQRLSAFQFGLNHKIGALQQGSTHMVVMLFVSVCQAKKWRADFPRGKFFLAASMVL